MGKRTSDLFVVQVQAVQYSRTKRNEKKCSYVALYPTLCFYADRGQDAE